MLFGTKKLEGRAEPFPKGFNGLHGYSMLSPTCMSFLQKCLCVDVDERYSVHQLMQHEYLDIIRKPWYTELAPRPIREELLQTHEPDNEIDLLIEKFSNPSKLLASVDVELSNDKSLQESTSKTLEKLGKAAIPPKYRLKSLVTVAYVVDEAESPEEEVAVLSLMVEEFKDVLQTIKALPNSLERQQLCELRP